MVGLTSSIQTLVTEHLLVNDKNKKNTRGMQCIVGASVSELCGILVLHRHVITATHNILHVCNVCTNSSSGSQGRVPSPISLPALC